MTDVDRKPESGKRKAPANTSSEEGGVSTFVSFFTYYRYHLYSYHIYLFFYSRSGTKKFKPSKPSGLKPNWTPSATMTKPPAEVSSTATEVQDLSELNGSTQYGGFVGDNEDDSPESTVALKDGTPAKRTTANSKVNKHTSLLYLLFR